jgi:hypothetical protein
MQNGSQSDRTFEKNRKILKMFSVNVYNIIKTFNTTKVLAFILLHVSADARHSQAKTIM